MEGTINLKEKSVDQLKALAYDLIGNIELNSNNLKIVNQEIANRQKDEQTLKDNGLKEG